MADSDVIRKLHIYRALFRMNRAFALLAHNLDWLTVHRVLAGHTQSDAPEWWSSHLAELQATINRLLTEVLHNLEHGDVRRLGRILEMAPQFREKYYPADRPERKLPRTPPTTEARLQPGRPAGKKVRP